MTAKTLGVCIGLMLLPVVGETSAQDTRKRAGDFNLPTTQGDSLQLSSLQGQIVLLNLWATWCAPCLKEMPDLNTLYEALKDDGFTIVGLAVDGDDTATIDRFVDRLGVTYPIVYGSVEDSQKLLSGSGNAIAILPTTLILDREGYILERIVGTVPIDETKLKLKALLGQ